LGTERMHVISRRVAQLRERLRGRVVWNVSSSAAGGGVAEMVRSLLAYARGAGVDGRWAVIQGPPEFFRLTKRLHNAIHGSVGDGSLLDGTARQLYERVAHENAAELSPMVRPNDVVIVHDPQPAGMVADLTRRGARVIWRCHIGHDERNVEVDRGWSFLAPYLQSASAYVFSRAAYVPPQLDSRRAVVIAPSLDPFSAKNQPLGETAVLAILACTGILRGPSTPHACVFVGADGAPSRVDRRAEVLRTGDPPSFDAPLVVQVSRWDRLKDPVGVLHGFARLDSAAHLVLAGPDVRSVADDPEGALSYDEVAQAWRSLPPGPQARAHLAMLPTVDVDENAAIVNALQRHATVVTQKSLHEGFGLTVTEALWKGRAVLASAVGGISDQIEDGISGLLLPDPTDLDGFSWALKQLLSDPRLRQRLGANGRLRVLDHYLGIDSLMRYGALIEVLDEGASVRDLAGSAGGAAASMSPLQRSGSSGEAPTREA
jgi:trehalose synthase